jgi:hypothetical protein
MAVPSGDPWRGIVVAERLWRDGAVAYPLHVSVEWRRVGEDQLGVVRWVVGLRHAQGHRRACGRRPGRGQGQRLDRVEGVGDSPFAIDHIHDPASEVRPLEGVRDRERRDIAARLERSVGTHHSGDAPAAGTLGQLAEAQDRPRQPKRRQPAFREPYGREELADGAVRRSGRSAPTTLESTKCLKS